MLLPLLSSNINRPSARNRLATCRWSTKGFPSHLGGTGVCCRERFNPSLIELIRMIWFLKVYMFIDWIYLVLLINHIIYIYIHIHMQHMIICVYIYIYIMILFSRCQQVSNLHRAMSHGFPWILMDSHGFPWWLPQSGPPGDAREINLSRY